MRPGEYLIWFCGGQVFGRCGIRFGRESCARRVGDFDSRGREEGRGRPRPERETTDDFMVVSPRHARARAAETRDRFYLFVCLFSVATVTRRSILACLKNGYTSNLTHL